jgi:hypothetical protein
MYVFGRGITSVSTRSCMCLVGVLPPSLHVHVCVW